MSVTSRPVRSRRTTRKTETSHTPPLFTVDGLEVVESHRGQGLPNVPFNYVKLTLSDGSTRYQCVDCPDIIGTRDYVRQHRRDVHAKKIAAVSTTAVLSMTVGQLVEAAESNLSAGRLIEQIEAERDRYRIELAELTKKYNALTKALEKAGFTPKLEED